MTYDQAIHKILELVVEGSMCYPGNFTLRTANDYFRRCRDVHNELLKQLPDLTKAKFYGSRKT